MQAILALEDGRIFHGKGYGAKGECYGEVVFNTSITGYQEIFTDPSYAGQIVVLTNPEIGNYGTNSDDNEATRPYIEGLIVREFSRVSSNWRSQEVAEELSGALQDSRARRDRHPRPGAPPARPTASCAASSPPWRPIPTSSSPRRARFRRWMAPTWRKKSPPATCISGMKACARTSRRKWSG